jgi:hypothetical protein
LQRDPQHTSSTSPASTSPATPRSILKDASEPTVRHSPQSGSTPPKSPKIVEPEKTSTDAKVSAKDGKKIGLRTFLGQDPDMRLSVDSSARASVEQHRAVNEGGAGQASGGPTQAQASNAPSLPFSPRGPSIDRPNDERPVNRSPPIGQPDTAAGETYAGKFGTGWKPDPSW